MPWLILFMALLLLFLLIGLLLFFLVSRKEKNCFNFGCGDEQICSRTGKCIPLGTCLVDTDCQSNLCLADKTCAPLPPLVEFCKESGDCTYAGYRCADVEGKKICINSCSNEEDCLGSQACLEGVCRPKPCLSNIDCPGGESCLSTINPEGEPGDYCIGGQPCEKTCPSSLICLGGECRECNQDNKENCANQVCRKESCLPCSQEVPCQEGKVCFSGSCCAQEGFGKPCQNEGDCSGANPYCVKQENDVGICTCSLLPKGERCYDSLSCLSTSCQAMGGDSANKRCSTSPCLVNEDCPLSTPFCAGICTDKLLGSNCPAGEESICTEKGYFCPLGTCRKEPPGYGERCLEECKEGLECRLDLNLNKKYKYCLTK